MDKPQSSFSRRKQTASASSREKPSSRVRVLLTVAEGENGRAMLRIQTVA
jgi:hypothetical protein